MRFISVVTFERGKATPHDDPECMERMQKLVNEMRADGTLVDTGGRASEMMEFSVTRKNSTSTVTDGPFAESKEIVGGYAVLEVKDRNHAIVATKRFLETLGADATCHLHEVFPPPPLSP